MVPFSLCFRSLTSPVPRSFHSGRSFSEANRNSFARLQEKPLKESLDGHREGNKQLNAGLERTLVVCALKKMAVSSVSTDDVLSFALLGLLVKNLPKEQDNNRCQIFT